MATRRLRAALRFFAPALPPAFVSAARRDVGWLADTIGAVRDVDVITELVKARARHLNRDARNGLGPFVQHLRDRRAAALDALVTALDSSRARRAINRLTDFAKSAPPARPRQSFSEAASDLIRPLLRAVRSSARRVHRDAPPEALHRVRVRIKRLRYALETLNGTDRKGIDRMLRTLARAQDVLGAYHDAGMVMTCIRDYAKAPGISATTLLAAEALFEDLARRSHEIRKQVPAVLHDVSKVTPKSLRL